MIIGRNSFQRPRDKAIELLGKIMSIYALGFLLRVRLGGVEARLLPASQKA